MQANRALVVDDSRVARLSMKKALEKCNLQVDCVESGESAIGHLQESADAPPGVIFMDNVMPGMDGLTAARRIRETWQEIPIIMCTGTAGDEYEREARAAGASGVIGKPTSAEVIGQLINRLGNGTPADQWLTDNGRAAAPENAASVPAAPETPASPPPAAAAAGPSAAELLERCETIESRSDVMAADQRDLRELLARLEAQVAGAGDRLQLATAQESQDESERESQLAELREQCAALAAGNTQLNARVEQLETMNAELAQRADSVTEAIEAVGERVRETTDERIAAAAEEIRTQTGADLQALLLPQFAEQIQSAVGQLEERLGERIPNLPALERRLAESATAAATEIAERVASERAREEAKRQLDEAADEMAALRSRLNESALGHKGRGRGASLMAGCALALAGGAAAMAWMF